MTPPIRVLIVTSSSRIGGAERLILHLFEAAEAERVQFELLSLMAGGELTEQARRLGVPARCWNLERLCNPCLPWRMKRYLRRGRFDLVQTYGLRADVVTRWAAGRLGIPVVGSIASTESWRRRPHVWLDRMTSGPVAIWISVCHATARRFMEREGFPHERIRIVYSGIPDAPPPDADQRQAARRGWGLKTEVPVIGVVANLMPPKGYPVLIRAMAILREEFPDIVCLCAGRDASEGRIPRLAREEGVESHFRWLGFQADPAPVRAAADLIVLASHWEGLPVTLIEAMREARPIVATTVGGVHEMIEDGVQGLLIAPGDPLALAQAIQRLLNNPERRARMGAAARRRFEERFRVECMMNQTLEVYNEVLKGR